MTQTEKLQAVHPDDHILKASDERLRVLSQRRLTKYSRRLLEAEAARRGIALSPVDDEGFPVRA